ncbi:class I adenylate-forming enzyme family protein [Nonomuraea sp. NPDC050786]|uniref:class I adenylate-forming enzyme family protein n=1 Tax=Nonomuraea sp. NPDC050786 TaxID=3154840 RepID=UPI003410457E
MPDRLASDTNRVHASVARLDRRGNAGPTSVLSFLDEWVAVRGDSICLTTVAANGMATTLTFRELEQFSRRLGYWLHHEVGVQVGDTLGILPVNDAPSVVAFFGLFRAGCPALVLNPLDPEHRLREQLAGVHARLVLRGPGVSAAVLPNSTLIPDPKDLPDPPAGWSGARLQPADDALYFGTSGSTAAAKLVAQTHANAVANSEAIRRHHNLGPQDRLLGCLPLHHVNGVHFTLFATLAAGAHAVLADRFNPFEYPMLLAAHRPTLASVVPSILEALIETWRAPHFPPEFRYFVTAAAPLAAATARLVHERFNVRILQGYGLTETTNFSTTMPPDLTEEAYRRLSLEPEIPSVGIPIPGNEVAILNMEGKRVEPGNVGEICMRGANVMSRYVNNEAATAEAFRGGWFHSQDLGFEMVEARTGRSFFFITGRIKNIAKVRGESVSLEEMEHALRAVPGIRDAACSARPEPLLGEVVVAAIVASENVTDELVMTCLRERFAEAVLPNRLARVAKIPRTPTGKILRPRLLTLLESESL